MRTLPAPRPLVPSAETRHRRCRNDDLNDRSSRTDSDRALIRAIEVFAHAGTIPQIIFSTRPAPVTTGTRCEGARLNGGLKVERRDLQPVESGSGVFQSVEAALPGIINPGPVDDDRNLRLFVQNESV